MAQKGLVIAGLGSGTGKTTVTLGLLRAFTRAVKSAPSNACSSFGVCAAKSGPDYIDTAFLAAACSAPAVNLDSYAMPPEMLYQLASAQPEATLIIEGVMGLFDGTDGGGGSTASLAATLGLPILLVIDARHQAQTAAILAAGIAAQLDPRSPLAGVVLNRTASPRHAALIAAALDDKNIRLFGSLPSMPDIAMPSRHLGLVQAGDLAIEDRLEALLERAGDLVAENLDLNGIINAAGPIQPPLPGKRANHDGLAGFMPPPGQRIAHASDVAFAFSYPHMISHWQAAGADILPFSPLANAAPASDADFIFLPGGYPELHLEELASANVFLNGLRAAAQRGTRIYGECGGFMTLGTSIIDTHGTAFPMAGLLPLETSFAAKKLHLGYRHLTPDLADWQTLWPGMPKTGADHPTLIAHEFHYSSDVSNSGGAAPLFNVANPAGEALGKTGLVSGCVFGSYAHIIATG